MKGEGREMYAGLFKGMATDTVRVPLSKEVLDQARTLAQENGWSEEEAFQIIFANGLFYLLGRRRRVGLDGHDADLAAEVKRLTTELIDMQGKYAVMKFRAFTLQQDNQTLEFQNTGLRLENGMAMSRLDKFREDEELLRAQLRLLQEDNERLRERLGVLEGSIEVPPPGPSLVRRVLPWLRR
jgi:hypothetical protein